MIATSLSRCTAALLAILLCACTTPVVTSNADTAGALAVRATLAAQIAHPEAVRNADPVSGVDGAAALQAQQKYEKSFGAKNPGADLPLLQRR